MNKKVLYALFFLVFAAGCALPQSQPPAVTNTPIDMTALAQDLATPSVAPATQAPADFLVYPVPETDLRSCQSDKCPSVGQKFMMGTIARKVLATSPDRFWVEISDALDKVTGWVPTADLKDADGNQIQPEDLETVLNIKSVPYVEVIPSATPFVIAVADTPAPAADPFADLPDCPYVDTGSPQPYTGEALTKVGDQWVLDMAKLGCAVVWEGRRDVTQEIHEVAVLRDLHGLSPLVVDGKFTFDEGSPWLYDRTWNMGDFDTPYTPIALMLASDKRQVMENAGYEWPIDLYESNGNKTTYGVGSTDLLADSENHCDFGEPTVVPVHGELQDDGSYLAAIGATGCVTYAWVDGSTTPINWIGQRDAEDKVPYTTIHVVMMPSAFDSDAIEAWLEAHPLGQ